MRFQCSIVSLSCTEECFYLLTMGCYVRNQILKLFVDHALEMEYLPRLSEAEIKELLPAIGDRITFRQAIEVKLLLL